MKYPLVVSFILCGLVGVSASAANSITITDSSGSGQTNRPFTISRVFTQGEFPAGTFPQARVGGSSLLTTQVDVKNTWSDGSIRHAMISFVASMGASATITVDFVSQGTGNNTGFLTKSQMTASPYNTWGADIEATNGTTQTANVLTMLAAWSGTDTGLNGLGVRYWLKGSICTQVIVEDRSAALAYDMGWDASKPLHPIFVVTFYPTSAVTAVKVEYILENDWTTKLEDQTYSLALKSGSALGTTAYTKASFTQVAQSRWRKVFWSGTVPTGWIDEGHPGVTVNYNPSYLVASKAIPNYDLTITVTPSVITADVSNFNGSDKGDINGHALWLQSMPTTGGRDDIGLIPAWYVRYLYSMDPGEYALLLGMAEASSSIPIHIRESASGKFYDSGASVNAFGLPLSIDARPTIYSPDFTNGGTSAGDKITPVGTMTQNGWTPEIAHYPATSYIPYLITGDWYFLEEMYFQAAWQLANGQQDTTFNGRHLGWGWFNDSSVQTRGQAWGRRDIAEAGFMAPDASNQKSYYVEKVNNNLAVEEGYLNTTTGNFYDPASTSKWFWGRNTAALGGTNPLHFGISGFSNDNDADVVPPADTNAPFNVDRPWQTLYKLNVSGHVAELGYTAQGANNTAFLYLVNILQNASFNPYLCGLYTMASSPKPGGSFYSTWSAVLLSVTTNYFGANLRTVSSWWDTTSDDNSADGYPHICQAAASYATGLSESGLTGQAAWNWTTSHINRTALAGNPQFSTLPRAAAAAVCVPAVSSPAAAQSVAGTAFTLSASLPGCAALGMYSVEYLVDGEPGMNYNAQDTVRCASCSDGAYNFTWNSNYALNGPHFVYAIVRDAKWAVLATSASVAFTVENALPVARARLWATVSCAPTACPQSVTPVALSGTETVTVTFSGTGAGVDTLHTDLLVDGNSMVGQCGSNVSCSFSWNTGYCLWNGFYSTSNCYNGLHNVVIRVTDLSVAGWQLVFGYEFQANVSNGAAVGDFYFTPGNTLFLVPGGGTKTITCHVRNVDQSSSNCTALAVSSNADSTCATVAVAGQTLVFTPNNTAKECSTQVFATASGLTETQIGVNAYVFAGAPNGVPNFGNDGAIYTGYTAGKSGFFGNIFQTVDAFGSNANLIWANDTNFTPTQWAQSQQALKCCAITPQIIDRRPNVGETQAQYAAWVATYVSVFSSLRTAYPAVYFHLRLDNLFNQTDWLYQFVHGYGSANASGWGSATTALQTVLQGWLNAGAIGGYLDEVNLRYGNNPIFPFPTNTTIGGAIVTNVVSNGAGGCTLNFAAGATVPLNSDGRFQLHGTGVTNLDSSSTTPSVYVGSISGQTITFACTGVAAGTYTAGTYEPFAQGWVTASPSTTFVANNGQYWTSGGTPAGPYVDYWRNNDFQNWITNANGSSSRPRLSFPPQASATNAAWQGPNSPSDYNHLYLAALGGGYLPHIGRGTSSQQMQFPYSSVFNSLRHGAPVWVLSVDIPISYAVNGRALTMTSVANGQATFSGDTGCRNVIDGDTRLQISGTGTALDDLWYVARCPTATTILIYGPAKATFAGAGAGGTIAYQNGDSYSIVSLGAATSSTYGISLTVTADSNCAMWTRNRGQTATISGVAGYTGITYYVPLNQGLGNGPPPRTTCVGDGNPTMYIYPLPATSFSGSATGTFLPHNKHLRGITLPSQIDSTGSEFGYVQYLGILACAIQYRCTGVEHYAGSVVQDPDGFDRLHGTFQDGTGHPPGPGGCNGGLQCTWSSSIAGASGPSSAHPLYDNAWSRLNYEVMADKVRLENRLAKWMYGPSAPGCDLGPGFDCAVHMGPNGNIVHAVYYPNGPWTRTFDFTTLCNGGDCRNSGQATIKYYGHWYDIQVSTLSAGTASDTVTGDANTFVAYVFSTNAVADLAQPAVNMRLADVTGAAKIVSHCAYSPWLLANAPPVVTDLGTGAGTLAADSAIGSSYCELLYLDVNGKALQKGPMVF